MTITTVELLAEWERLETAFHDNLPSQGECGDPSHGKALCQFVYDNSDTLRTLISNLVKERTELREVLVQAALLLGRYRKETPLGHQPHMIAVQADAAILKADAILRSNLDKEEGDNG